MRAKGFGAYERVLAAGCPSANHLTPMKTILPQDCEAGHNISRHLPWPRIIMFSCEKASFTLRL
jgi:hypothetical protein